MEAWLTHTEVHIPRLLPLLAFSVFLIASSAQAQTSGRLYKGTVRGLDDSSPILYHWEFKQCPDRWRSTYTRPDGSVSVVDETWFEQGRVVHYGYHRPTTGERSSVKYSDGIAHFEHEELGTKRSKERSVAGTFLTGHTLPQFVHEHLADLKEGKQYEVRYGVLGKMDDYGFRLSALESAKPGEVTIQMLASSAFVRMAVDPVLLTFTDDGRFLRLAGRLLPMELENGRLMPIDGTLTATSDAPITCPLKEPPLSPAR